MLLALLLALISLRPGAAQSLWTRPYQPNQISLELLQPALDTAPDEELSFLTGAGTLAASYLATDRTSLVVQVPFAHYASDVGAEDPASVSETTLGNPYLGLGLSSTRVPLFVELGARLPVASDSTAATFVGGATDLDRSEAFAPHLFSTHLIVNTRWELSRAVSVRFRGGPLLTTPTPDGTGSTELYARYSAQGWFEGDRYVFGFGLTGRAPFTEGGDFTDVSAHQVGATLIFNVPYLHPGLLVRTPLNGPASDDVGVILGLTLSTAF